MNQTASVQPERDFMGAVRELCRLLGIRQKELAGSLGLKPAQMNLYFQGKVEMRGDRQLQLLKILGIDVEAQVQAKIREHGGDEEIPHIRASKLLASMGGLDESKKRSLLRIIRILGSK